MYYLLIKQICDIECSQIMLNHDHQCKLIELMGLIYETNVRPKIGHMVISTQNLEFINMDVFGGYDQISRQVWARVRKFLS